MTKVLLIGNGAREHAIALSLVKSGVQLYAHMEQKNPGISKLAQDFSIGSITDTRRMPTLDGYDYVVIGPEAPLASGVSDFILSHGVPCIGPNQAAAMIETSKSFARIVIAQTTPDANPEYEVARSLDDLRKFEDKVGVGRMVVKPNGLTGGKGVRIFGEHLTSKEELEKYAIDLLTKAGVVVLEEKLVGTEFTLQAFTDGKHLEFMPLVRDYKRAYDGDEGPNTGSMGSYSESSHSLSFISTDDVDAAKSIMSSTLIGIKKKTGSEFKGILYGQFMKTSEGIKVIEYNARFGDPEAMNVLAILSNPLDEIYQSIIDGNLKHAIFENAATVCVYLVPEGYPGPGTMKNQPLSFDTMASSELYYASVFEREGQILTTGSRAIAVLGKAETVTKARQIAYADVQRVKGRIRFRTDIALNI